MSNLNWYYNYRLRSIDDEIIERANIGDIVIIYDIHTCLSTTKIIKIGIVVDTKISQCYILSANS